MKNRRTDTAIVSLWGVEVGAVTWDAQRDLGVFKYMPSFVDTGVQLAPLKMPLANISYQFPELDKQTFKGLPGLLADALPDKFGNALIDRYLTDKGLQKDQFTPVDRLCYIGSRAMGALEFAPAMERAKPQDHPLDIDAIVKLASRILTERSEMKWSLIPGDDPLNEQALADILQVGISAGGARAKAVIAWNEQTNEVRSGQITLPSGFKHWLIKFDGVANNKDKELADSEGYGQMEYVYHRMAIEAGIHMSECRLFKESSRQHFMTRRFDRTDHGERLHMQSLGALQHFDFNRPGAYSYEQAMETAQKLGVGRTGIEQLFLRALFNIMARNQDDHVKNIAFLMDASGEWRLAPAFDLTFSYNPEGEFTSRHQMTLNGKSDAFTLDDFYTAGKRFGISRVRVKTLMGQVAQGVLKWRAYADAAGVAEKRIDRREKLHRFFLEP